MADSLPIVTVYSEVTADGKTTHKAGRSSKPMMDFEDDPIRIYRHTVRASSQGIMVGANTVRTDDPSLTVRYVQGANPLRIVPTSTGKLRTSSVIFTDGNPTLLALSESVPKDRRRALAATGVDLVTLGEDRVNLRTLFEYLYAERGVKHLMVEGGATLLAEIFRTKLANKLIVQHLPVIFGGCNVPAMVGGDPIEDVDQAIHLTLLTLERIGTHAVITYQVEP